MPYRSNEKTEKGGVVVDFIKLENDPCPICGAKLEVINKPVKVAQSPDGRIRRMIERFNRCTNTSCNYIQARGSGAYTNF